MFLNACRARAAQRVSAGTYARSITQDRDTVTALLNTADTFFMNDNEASLLFGSVSSAVTRANALLFVTLGAAGALAIEGNHHLRVAAPATQDLDPTGAGDTFCGTVLAHLLDGANVIDACSAACRAASRMIAQPGPAALLA
jgi:ribokinase